MRAEERAQQSESSISLMELICSPTLRAPLIIGIVMQLSQQFSGINAVSYKHAKIYFHFVNIFMSILVVKFPIPMSYINNFLIVLCINNVFLGILLFNVFIYELWSNRRMC